MKQHFNWSAAANVATSLGLIVALLVFAWEIRSQRQQQSFNQFLRFIDAFEKTASERRGTWVRIRDTLRDDPDTAAEVHDRQHSLGYLKLRVAQNEGLFAVEHQLLELELRSLNLLDEACRLALEDPAKMSLLKPLLSSEVSYYQSHLPVLLELVELERRQRLFSIPHHGHLEECDVASHFEQRGRDFEPL